MARRPLPVTFAISHSHCPCNRSSFMWQWCLKWNLPDVDDRVVLHLDAVVKHLLPDNVAWKQILLKFWAIAGHLVPPYRCWWGTSWRCRATSWCRSTPTCGSRLSCSTSSWSWKCRGCFAFRTNINCTRIKCNFPMLLTNTWSLPHPRQGEGTYQGTPAGSA